MVDKAQEKQEYKLANGWAIFVYIGTPLVIGLFSWLFLMPFIDSTVDAKASWILGAVSACMIGVAVIGLLEAIKGRFVIATDKIVSIGVFSVKELKFNEIKGYRVSDKHIFIESLDAGKRKIKVSTYFGKSGEIIDWLATHYRDLDISQADQEKEEILDNEAFGMTTELREQKLAKAIKTARFLNWAGALICIWTLFIPRPYEYAIIASVVLPVICLIALKYFRGLIRIDERKLSAYPSIFMAVLFSVTGLCVRGVTDYNVFDHSKVWNICLLVTFIYMALLIAGNKEFTFKKAKDYVVVTGLSIFMFGYSYGAVVSLNCLFDRSKPEIYNTTVLDKRISSGKTTKYYLELKPWGQQKEAGEVAVSKKLYNRLDKDAEVKVYFMKGLFEIPWIRVTE
ncbi:MAG: hypothetical protein QM731_06720 [Chitinophagaceae bacterium]